MPLRVFVCLVALVGMASAQDAAKVQQKAIRDLVATPTRASWETLFETYPTQPGPVKIEVLRSIEEMSVNFGDLLLAQPHLFKNGKYPRFTKELTALVQQLNAEKSPTEELRNRFSATCRELSVAASLLNKEEVKDTTAWLVKRLSDLLEQGLADPNPAVREAAIGSFLNLAGERYRSEWVSRRFGCGNIEKIEEYNLDFECLLSPRLREIAGKNGAALSDVVRKKQKGYEAVAVALAEVHSPSIKPLFLSYLESTDQELGQLGEQCAIAWPTPEALPKLMKRLENLDEERYWYESNVDEALMAQGEEAPKTILSAWSSLSVEAKFRALQCVGDLPCSATLTLVNRGVSDPDSKVRSRAAARLRSLQNNEWNEKLSGPDPRDLTKEDIDALATRVIALLDDPAPKVREEAIWALGEERLLVQDLKRFLNDPSEKVRLVVECVAGNYESIEAVELLWQLLKDPSKNVRQAAQNDLVNQADLASTHAEQGLRSPNPFIRATSVAILGSLGEPARIVELQPLLKDREPSVRIAVLGALRDIGEPAIEAILSVSSDSDDDVVKVAVMTLAEMRSDKTKAALSKMAGLVRPELRGYVLKALGKPSG